MASVLGFGGYVPDRIMTNEDWAKLVDTSDEWITQRTGIKERRIAADDQSTLDLAEHAARMALHDAGMSADDIGEIIVATDTPEAYLPDTASFLQDRLGAGPIPAFDLGASGCAGFVQALDVARARLLLRDGPILVVGVEVLSRLLSKEDRSTAVLFGDGAGAVVLAREGGSAQVLDVTAGTDGSKTDILALIPGGTRQPFGRETFESGSYNRLVMHGQEVFKQAVHRMTDAIAEVLGSIGRDAADVALVVPHQANKRIIDAVAHRLGMDDEKVYINVHRYGNTGSASVPFALWEARTNGHISEGDLVILTAFGAGFHWAAAAIQF